MVLHLYLSAHHEKNFIWTFGSNQFTLGTLVWTLQISTGALLSVYERETKDGPISPESCKIQEEPQCPFVLDHRQKNNEGENGVVWRER